MAFICAPAPGGVGRISGDGIKVQAKDGSTVVVYPRMIGFRAFMLKLTNELKDKQPT
jgi:hypothetical protein